MKHFRILFIVLSFVLFVSWLDPYKDEVDRGNALLQQKKYDDALKAYDNAKQYVPSKDEEKKLSFNRGNALYMLKEYNDAIIEYSRAIQLEDKQLQKKAFYNMGNAYLKQGNVEKAAQSYMNALKIDPSYVPPKKNIEYLLKYKDNQKKNKDKKKKKDKQGKDKNNKKDKQQKDKNKDDKNDKKQQNKDQNQNKKDDGSQKKAKLSKEQLKNLLEKMKKKPVRRQKGGDTRVLDKNW